MNSLGNSRMTTLSPLELIFVVVFGIFIVYTLFLAALMGYSGWLYHKSIQEYDIALDYLEFLNFDEATIHQMEGELWVTKAKAMDVWIGRFGWFHPIFRPTLDEQADE